MYPDHGIKLMKELDVPCWIAGGYLLSCFTDKPWKDIIAGGAITFECEDFMVDLMYNGVRPRQTIRGFDFTICCCSLDHEGMLEYHRDYFDDIKNKRIVYTGACQYSDLYRRLWRLRSYIHKGYGLDQQGILGWIDGVIDQHNEVLQGWTKYRNEFETERRPIKSSLFNSSLYT